LLDSGGGGEKKKKKNNSNDSPINTIMESGTSPATSAPKVVNEEGMNEVGTTVLESFPPLPTQVTTSAGNAPGKSLYANVTGKSSGKKLNNRTLFTPEGNGIDVVVSVESIRDISRSSYARVMIELRADMELKDNIVVAMPRIKGDDHYICAGEKKTLKKPSQTSRGVPVGPKMRFKPHKEYRHVSKNLNGSSSGNKKKGVEPTIKVSNSNPFDVLNSVDNDAKLGTSKGFTSLVNNEATSNGPSFMNVDNNTSIIDKIRKFEDLLSSGQAILVDNAGNPLKKVEFSGDYDSEDEVASADNDMARSLASERVGFSTQSLLEQWRDSYGNGDYDEDPYDEDI
nr:hypothetical protein [Tanacetum cinerariifolium]